MSSPALSIIVPIFNAESFLPRLLASIPSRRGIEVVLVDDGSNDNSQEVCTRWKAVGIEKVMVQLDHVGPGAARQMGVDTSRGRFVFFADADDELIGHVIGDMVDLALAMDLDVVIGGYELIDRPNSLRLSPQQTTPVAKRCASHRALTDRAAIWGKLYRRQFLTNNNLRFEPLRIADDVLFSWAVASAKPKTAIYDQSCYRYFVDPHGQLTRDPKYFEEAIVSLALLLVKARNRDILAKGLAAYAVGTGVFHLLKKTTRSSRFSLLLMSARELMLAINRSSSTVAIHKQQT